MALVLTNLAKELMLIAACSDNESAPGPFYHCELRLIQGTPPTPSPNSDRLMFTECDYDGYAKKTALELDNFVEQQNGSISAFADAQAFELTGEETTNTVVGHMLCSSSSGNALLAVEIWEESVTLAHDGQGFILVPEVSLKSNDYGDTTVVA